jgi:uncharacterized membrane protein YphA (DoxX/SURF4 family)
MLNPFPEFLVFGFFAPTLLRIALGVYFIYLGRMKFGRDKEKVGSFFQSLGIGPGSYYLKTLAFAEVIVGTLLIVGFFVQIAALIAAIISLVSLVMAYKHPEMKILKASEYALLLVISVTLMFTGAGFLAFDLPL